MRARAIVAACAGLLVVGGSVRHTHAQATKHATSPVSPMGWKQAAYIKASNPGEGDQFGFAVSLSADGNTLAVGAPNESSSAKGINGNQNDNAAFSSGAVYVLTRTAKGWAQQAYLKASNPDKDDQFGGDVALSADGNTLAVAAKFEDSAATGINGNQADNSFENSGAVYVFSRTGSTWSQQAYIKASNTGEKDEGDQFGYSIAISGDGNALAVGAIGEDSNANGINGDQANNMANGSGAAYVFARSGSTWSQQAYVKSTMTRPNVLFGYSIGLSGNGNTLVVGEFDADRGKGALYAYTRSGGMWTPEARMQAANAEAQDSIASSLSLSEDGNTLASGALDEDSLLTGVQPNDLGANDGKADTSAGAAYVFTRTGTTWSQQAYMKASNTGMEDWFGVRLGLSGDGSTVAVAAPNEDSAAKGINGKMDDDSADEAGAVYVFSRTDGKWMFRDYIKGSNTEKYDEFGSAVSLSRDGRMMAIGAHFQSGGAKGVNGNHTDRSVMQSGAVYVFVR